MAAPELNSKSLDAGTPFARATLVSGSLFIQGWKHWFDGDALEGSALRQATTSGVTVCDLARELNPGMRELFLITHSGQLLNTSERGILEEWATNVGYHRIWLEQGTGVIELPGGTPFGRLARSTCSRCLFEHVMGSVDFWRAIAGFGQFPSICNLCGGQTLPQWDVDEAPEVGPEEGELLAELNGSFSEPWDAVVSQASKLAALDGLSIEDLTTGEMMARAELYRKLELDCLDGESSPWSIEDLFDDPFED